VGLYKDAERKEKASLKEAIKTLLSEYCLDMDALIAKNSELVPDEILQTVHEKLLKSALSRFEKRGEHPLIKDLLKTLRWVGSTFLIFPLLFQKTK
jgi:hypothetical protein